MTMEEMDRIASEIGLRSRAVVIAGDDAVSRSELAERLQHLGSEVKAVGRLHDVAAFISNRPGYIDLLVYENIPGMVGMDELFRWLKQHNPSMEFIAYDRSRKQTAVAG